MRILYFTHSDSPHDNRFLTAIRDMGHEVAALRLRKCSQSVQTPDGVHEIPWEGCQGKLTLPVVAALIPKIKHILKEYQPEVVHAGPIQETAFLMALTGVTPLLSMSWGYDLLWDAEKDAYSRWVTHYALNRSAMLLSDCQTVVQKADAFGFNPANTVVFPWGVDLEHFSKHNANLQSQNLRQSLGWEDQLIILGLRTWEPVYGVDVLARAFVLAARQDPRLRLLLLGQGSQEVHIKAILEKGSVSDRVRFGGRVPPQDLPAYYGVADLYVSSSHVDGSSVSLLEAMACETPVLVSDIAGNREWVEPSKTGSLFPDSDAHALAEAMLTSAKKAASPNLVRNARKLVEAKADWQKNVQLLDQAYHRLVKIEERS